MSCGSNWYWMRIPHLTDLQSIYLRALTSFENCASPSCLHRRFHKQEQNCGNGGGAKEETCLGLTKITKVCQDWRWITKPILSECIWFIEWMKQFFGIHKVSGSHPQPQEQTGTGWKVNQLTIHAVDASLSYGQSQTCTSLLSKFSHCTFIIGKLTKSIYFWCYFSSEALHSPDGFATPRWSTAQQWAASVIGRLGWLQTMILPSFISC